MTIESETKITMEEAETLTIVGNAVAIHGAGHKKTYGPTVEKKLTIPAPGAKSLDDVGAERVDLIKNCWLAMLLATNHRPVIS